METCDKIPFNEIVEDKLYKLYYSHCLEFVQYGKDIVKDTGYDNAKGVMEVQEGEKYVVIKDKVDPLLTHVTTFAFYESELENGSFPESHYDHSYFENYDEAAKYANRLNEQYMQRNGL